MPVVSAQFWFKHVDILIKKNPNISHSRDLVITLMSDDIITDRWKVDFDENTLKVWESGSKIGVNRQSYKNAVFTPNS